MAPVTNRGQALLELAIFGAFFLSLLAVLLSYGLKAEWNQQVMMESFRKALGLASARGTAAVAVVRDNPLPNPSNPFAVGSVLPAGASANVTKDFQLADRGGASARVLIDLDDQINVDAVAEDALIREYTVATARNICDAEILSMDLLRRECRKDSSPWCCSKIDQLFAGIGTMGLQPGRVQDAAVTTSLEKAEDTSTIATTQSVGWQEQVRREVITRPEGDESGAVKVEVITVTPKDQDTSTTWSTPWD